MMIKNQKGLTIPELVIGIGLSAVVISVVVAVQVQMAKEQDKLVKQLDDSIDQNQAERIVYKDLAGVEVSYNNLKILDDNANNFYDYIPDVTENTLTGTLSREFTLSLATKSTEFIVMTQNPADGALLNYDPVWAYDVGKDPGNPNIPADLAFSAKKNRTWMTNEKNGGRPGFWKDGNVLMYDTPSRIRPVVNGTINMSTPPRSPIYIGSISINAGDNLQPVGNEILSKLNMTQPSTGESIPNLDTFLRKLPSVGGGQTIVRLRSVRIIKYSLEQDTKKIAKDYNVVPANLMVSEYRNGQWSNKRLLADGIDKMVFRRDSIIKRMIYYKITKAKRLDGLNF
ncbi:hypothetical protein B9G69_014915 [Bdellovibrio sp. SKB1291214]|uniref:hypothetical protein n=1 Tax=Bdellovibrio sp. SKB1291214 TaxID=1732569 RepID=UPI000B516456|nr:hypothetical protein [Bdellovibrio sp. SKB1291214]UYL08331.1 hypothetical protein B9G69_014915 [Bdellovibrio sp. SKB1291214]